MAKTFEKIPDNLIDETRYFKMPKSFTNIPIIRKNTIILFAVDERN